MRGSPLAVVVLVVAAAACGSGSTLGSATTAPGPQASGSEPSAATTTGTAPAPVPTATTASAAATTTAPTTAPTTTAPTTTTPTTTAPTTTIDVADASAAAKARAERAGAAVPKGWTGSVIELVGPNAPHEQELFTSCAPPGPGDLAAGTAAAWGWSGTAGVRVGAQPAPQVFVEARVFSSADARAAYVRAVDRALTTPEGQTCLGQTLSNGTSANEVSVTAADLPIAASDHAVRLTAAITLQQVVFARYGYDLAVRDLGPDGAILLISRVLGTSTAPVPFLDPKVESEVFGAAAGA